MLRHSGSSLLKAAQRLQSSSGAMQTLTQAHSALLEICGRSMPAQTTCSRGFAVPAEEQDVLEASDRVKQLAEEIMHLNLLEVADLTEILQKRLGVAPGFGGMPMGGMMAPQGAPTAAAEPAAEAPKEAEKTEFDVKLEGFDAAAKIKVIKEIRVITELGLKEAKELVEKSPVVIKGGLKKEEAEELKKKIEAVGGKVALE